MVVFNRVLMLAAIALSGLLPAQNDKDKGWLDPQIVYFDMPAGTPVKVGYRRTEPSLGTMGVGFVMENLTDDKLEVKLTKRYWSGGRALTDRHTTIYLDPRKKMRGGRFSGDDLGLWDDFFYPDDLKKGEVVDRVSVSIDPKNTSAESRQKEAAERKREQADKEERKRAEELRRLEERRRQEEEERRRGEQRQQREREQQDQKKRVIQQRLDQRLAALQSAQRAALSGLTGVADAFLKQSIRERINSIGADARRNAAQIAEDGVTPCGGCGGTGFGTCNSCNGGWTDCAYPSCESGKIGCSGCRGTGQLGKTRCPLCLGSGKKDCSVCVGLGRKPCSSCTGAQLVRCDSCGGSGRGDR